MVTARPSLYRDRRGGVESVLYVMAIAGIAIVALPGVRHFTRSAQDSFEGSTQRFDRPGTYVGGDIQAASGRDWGLDLAGSGGEDNGELVLVAYEEDEAPCSPSSIDAAVEEGYQNWAAQPGNSTGHGWVDRQYYLCYHAGLGMQEISGPREVDRSRGRPGRPEPGTAERCTREIAERNRNIERGRVSSSRGCADILDQQQDDGGRHPITEAENRACHLAGVTAWVAFCTYRPLSSPGAGGLPAPPTLPYPPNYILDICSHPERYFRYDSDFEYCFWNR